MSTSDITSIPLPMEPSSTDATRKTAREMLQEALKDHPVSASQESGVSTKCAASKMVSGIGTTVTAEGGGSSQSIVDELFKDFIAQKISSTTRNIAEATDDTSSRVRSSADEISKILDMEINSLRSQTENKNITKQVDKLVNKKSKKSDATVKQSTFIPPSISEKEKWRQKEDLVIPQCNKEFGQPVVLNNMNPSLSAHKFKVVSECESRTDAAHGQSVILSIQHAIPAAETSSTTLAASSTGALAKSLAPLQTTDNGTTIKKNIMLPTSVAKKMMPPKVLGVKLSTQSLSLITSTDKIDRDGRVWEEGEVQSSQSEGSEKDTKESDSEPDGLPSDSGSVHSNMGDWKTESSKHNKEQKHKHKKKKKKKSSTEEDKDSDENDKHKNSKAQDKEKNKGRDKDTDKKDKDTHKTHIKEDNTNTNSSKDRVKSHTDKGNNVEKLEKQQSKTEIEKGLKEKDKSIDREHEESKRKDKKAKNKRRKSRSRSKSPKRRKRSHTKSPKRRDSWSSAGSRYSEWDARRYSEDPSKFSSRDRSRSRSRSEERSSDRHRRSREKSRSRERQNSKDGQVKDLRLNIDKAKLRKIAIANALQNMRANLGPQVDLTVVKSGGKSVEELTEFCKRISERSKAKADIGDPSSSDEDVPKVSDDEEMPIHHPFKVKDAGSSNIVMNIRNAKQLPIMTPSEKQAQQATLRLTFPVSSGSHHRASESEWVPVVKTPAGPAINPPVSSVQVTSEAPAEPKKADSIFPQPSETQKLDIGTIISERLQAVRKLQQNPFDMQALSKMHQVQEQASKWATSQHLPGQFTGSTGAHVLSQEQLIGDKKHQAWAKKTQLSHAAPVQGGIGMFLLQKMGWKQGEGLGKHNEGSKEPLMLDVKIDRRGLTTATENPKLRPQAVNVPRVKDLSNKHPVSALMEMCNRRRWGPPQFTVVSESGPDHKKSFLFKVKVNNVEYQPAMPSSNKKTAKAQCAAICLQEMGLLPRDAPLNI